MNTLNTKTLTLTALCAALLCVLSPMSIPLPGGVPISLATLAAAFAGALLGPKYGTLSVLLYLLLGAFGLPVFAGYSAGRLPHRLSFPGLPDWPHLSQLRSYPEGRCKADPAVRSPARR